MCSYYRGWAPYVSVAKRRLEAEKKVKAMVKKGEKISPVQIEGRSIANTFWGKAWCVNLENYSDYENRMPRGRTYVRNGSVLDLQISKGKVTGMVSGSNIYHTSITIKELKQTTWKKLVKSCVGQIESVFELLQGTFSKSVMEIMTDEKTGLFPEPDEISMKCTCPDGAYMCKHLAAMLYGVGARLDNSPELLFVLRHVEHTDLITAATKMPTVSKGRKSKKIIADSELSDVFGIDIA